MTSSASFIYGRVLSRLQEFLPAASLEYSETFWDQFETYPFDNDTNAQCIVGELEKIEHGAINCVFKISRSEDNLVLHEYGAIRQITELLGEGFPHICRTYGTVKYKGPLNIMNGPSAIAEGEKFVYRDMLLIENIPAIGSIIDMMWSKPFHITLSLFKQVLMCIRYFREAKITHYDLHPDNILVKKCASNVVLQYRNGARIPTFGFIAVVIDFGFAHVNQGDDIPLYADVKSASHGYISDRFMPFSDYIRFFFTLCYDVRKITNPKVQKLRKKMLKIFHRYVPFVDRQNGWEKSNFDAHIDEVDDILTSNGITKEVNIFDRPEWLDIIQLLMPARPWPVPSRGEHKLDISAFKSFCEEWKKIQSRITNEHLLFYLFKYLVNSIRLHPNDPFVAKSIFLTEFSRLVNSFLPSIDYLVIFEALHRMANSVCISLALFLERRQKEMFKFYQKLPFDEKTCDDYIWNKLDKEFSISYDADNAAFISI